MSERPPRLRLVRPEAPPRDASGATRELAALGSVLVFVAVLLARIPSWRAELGTFQALLAVAFAAYALALARAPRAPDDRATLLVVFGVAAAARVALLPVPPSLSDDVFRYLWEGRVLGAGLNPYAWAPDHPALAGLRDASIHPRINHPQLAAIYPPLALAGFALVSALSYTVLAMKLWVVAWDLALCATLLAWARGSGAGAAMALAYAWNPLVLAEYAGTGHHDPVALAPLVLAFAWSERRPLGSALALSAAVLTRLAPLLALPFLWRRWNTRARAAAVGLIAAGAGAQLVLTGALDRERSGLAAYATRWRHNDPVFGVLEAVAGGPDRARWLAAALLLAFMAWMLARRTPAVTGGRRALGAALLLSPVLHPWYLGWVLAFQPLGLSPGWLLLSCTAFVSYGVGASPAAGGAWHPSATVRLLEYGPPLVVAGIAWWWRRRREGA